MYDINNLPTMILIGRQTETGVEEIAFDCSGWLEKWPGMQISILAMRPGEADAYPAAIRKEGAVVVWEVNSSDTAIAGGGYAELIGVADGKRKISCTINTRIMGVKSDTVTEPPEAAKPWVDQVLEAAKRAEDAAERAEDAGGGGSGGSGGITKETDPTVPAWAKQPNKPTYTAEEVGAQPKGNYALKSEIPSVPVQSVNNKTGAVQLTADDVGAASKVEVERLSEEVDEVQAAVLGSEIEVKSPNLYDAYLQTPDTIDPHYYYNGAPYPTTQFDSSYNCTAPIPVEPNTQYTVGLVPTFSFGNQTNVVTPWNTSKQGLFFYTADNEYISGTYNNTFVTPANAAYIRFNYMKYNTSGVTLDVLNARCMLVKGDALTDAYQAYGESYHIKTGGMLPPVRYAINGNVLKLACHYGSGNDLLVTMGKGGGNNLFEFSSFALIPSGAELSALTSAMITTFLRVGTDWHAPFQVAALNNIDGDKPNEIAFTGGNHQYNNTGSGSTASARTTNLKFFVDGAEKTEGSGYAQRVEIRWENNVQGYNTEKADGTGREILKECHTLIFDGDSFSECIKLIPLEDVKMVLWYGLQFSGHSTVYPKARYIGATNRGEYTGASSSGDNKAVAIDAYGDTHTLRVEIDPTFDIGTRQYYSGANGAFTSESKGYFNFFTNNDLISGDAYYLKGKYTFRPVD